MSDTSPAQSALSSTHDQIDLNQINLSQIDLSDQAGEPARGTSSMLAALLARAATLQVISGAQAMASISAGLAKLGREVAETIEGQRVRDAIASARPGQNLQLLFDEFHFGDLASLSSPTSMLEDFRNDLALVVADDLAEAVEVAQLGAGQATGLGPLPDSSPIDPVDFMVGLWAYSAEVVTSIEALVDDLSAPAPVVVHPAPDETPSGRLLR